MFYFKPLDLKTLKILLVLFFSCFLFQGCVNISNKNSNLQNFGAVKISKVLDCSFNIRAIKADPQHVFFAGSEGQFGYLNSADNSIAYIGSIEEKGKKPDFRAIAETKKYNLLLSTGNPALLYKVNFFGKRKLLYQQNSPGTFYDAMKFWNDKEGLAIGDPINGCMSFLITRDGGKTWNPIHCRNLPKAEKGEAAFAASNSNIEIIGDKTWVITGGKTSRVYFSPDKGKTWKVFDTPLIKDKNTTGGYSIDFYNSKLGIIVGGDYTATENNHANKALTTDSGKTWRLIAEDQDPGYQSCVKFVPGSEGKEIVSVGITGIYYSSDRGQTWSQLSDKGFYTIDFLNGYTAYAAGKGRIAKLTFFEKL